MVTYTLFLYYVVYILFSVLEHCVMDFRNSDLTPTSTFK